MFQHPEEQTALPCQHGLINVALGARKKEYSAQIVLYVFQA